MEATKLEKQAKMFAVYLMSDKRFNDMVSAAARTSSDKEYNAIQLLLVDAYTALVEYNVHGKPISEENTEILLQCLAELKRLSDNEWLRMSGCFSHKPLN